MYSDIFNQLTYTRPEREKQRTLEDVASENIRRLKISAMNQFEELEDCNLVPPKLHMLDHILKGVSRFGTLNLLDASPF